jgi:hypothetical protein
MPTRTNTNKPDQKSSLAGAALQATHVIVGGSSTAGNTWKRTEHEL